MRIYKMKRFLTFSILPALLFISSCQEATLVDTNSASDNPIQNKCLFAPGKIRLTQLTEFTENWKITAYIDVFDQFGSRIKASGIWRFELFNYVPRSAGPMGSRIYIWKDIDLTDAKINNDHWQDFMRSYKIVLEMDREIAAGKTYILSATYLTADGKRITDSIQLKL